MRGSLVGEGTRAATRARSASCKARGGWCKCTSRPAAEEPVAATGGDVAELLDIALDQGAGMGVLVAADGLATDPVQLGQAADPGADQGGCTVGASPTWGAIWAGPSRCL